MKRKTRFDGLDVAAMVGYIQRSLLGHKVVNIYDGIQNDKTFLIKLAGSGQQAVASSSSSSSAVEEDGGGNSGTSKQMLLLESGIRFHTTTGAGNATTPNSMPSGFTMKLRKHLRNLRLESIQQLGNLDRVVDFRFGSGPNQAHHLILELYAQGNVILTNAQYEILTLLRTHEYKVSDTAVIPASMKQKGEEEEKKTSDEPTGGTTTANDVSVVKVGVRQIYPVTLATTLKVSSQNESDDKEGDEKMENSNDEKQSESNQPESNHMPKNLQDMTGEQAQIWAKEELQAMQDYKSSQQQDAGATADQGGGRKGGGGKKKGNKGNKKSQQQQQNDPVASLPLKALLLRKSSGVYHYGPSIIEHCILCANLNPLDMVSIDNVISHADDTDGEGRDDKVILSTSQWSDIIDQFRVEAPRILKAFQSDQDNKGFILYALRDGLNGKDDETENVQHNGNHIDKTFLEFQPHLLKQHENLPYLEYNNFSMAVDDFFTLLESQKTLQKAEQSEKAIQTRLEKIRQDQESRMEALERDQSILQHHASLVELHATVIDQVLLVVNSALENGMGWEELNQLIEIEQTVNQNPVAQLIDKVLYDQEAVVVKLEDTISTSGSRAIDEEKYETNEDNDDDEKDHNNIVLVTVSLHHTAHGNAREMYDRYRSLKEKHAKTVEASTKALKAAEITAQKQLEAAQQTRRLAAVSGGGANARKPNWFEKFHWCITSDNYLVVGGRDAQQNEQLVKRYLRPGDAYLHADVHGAASCILRAKRRRRKQPIGGKGATEVLPLSDIALREAGSFCICRSAAWSSKMITSAWWVEAHQVSKTAPTGEYLTVGSFMVRGKKNFLPASQLELGLAVLFRLGDESSIARHVNERRDFALLQEEDEEKDNDDINSEDEDEKRNVNKTKQKVSGNPRDRKQFSTIHNTQSTLEDEGSSQSLQEEQVGDEVMKYDRTLGEDGDLSAFVRHGKTKKEEDNITGAEEGKEESNADDTCIEGDAGDGDGCDDDNKSTNDKEASEKGSSSAKKKKGLSARDRKLIKKYGSLEAAEEAIRKREEEEKERWEAKTKVNDGDSNEHHDEQGSGATGNAEKSGKDNTRQQKNKNVRGKKTKLKKAALKYADQDDEDRERAMLLLQGGEKQKKKDRSSSKGNKGASKNATAEALAMETKHLLVKDAAEVAETLDSAVKDVLANCVTVDDKVRWDKLDATSLEQLQTLDVKDQVMVAKRLLELTLSTRVANYSSSLSGIIRTVQRYGTDNLLSGAIDNDAGTRGTSRKTKAEKEAEKESWKEILAEDGIIQNDDEDGDGMMVGGGDDTMELSKLSGMPTDEDVLLYAIPVCAPYASLSKYKYKVKLTPGSLKRGKAVKQCLAMFQELDKISASSGGAGSNGTSAEAVSRCRDLIKSVPDNDWLQTITGDVKISAPGASKLVKKQKANSKKGKK